MARSGSSKHPSCTSAIPVSPATRALSAAELYDQRALLGQLLETFVVGEICKQAGGHLERIALYRLRDKDGYEVESLAK